MKRLLEKLKSDRRLAKNVLVFSLFLLVIAVPVLAQSVSGGIVASMIAWICAKLAGAIGYILIFLLSVMVQLAQYNSFISSPAVSVGWTIVRDVCNMFFVLILLIIAFATILRLDGYNWKKDVPRLLIYAVLINFSKTICGLAIDLSQVFMLTFVNAVATNGAANLAIMFQLDKASSFANVGDAKMTDGTIIAGAVASLLAIIIVAIVVVAIITTLVMRMIFIWIYVILSPAAFLMNAFNGGKSYFSQWQKKFTTELIGGPVLAFFLWLALSVANNTPNVATIDKAKGDAISGGIDLFTNGPFQKYIIVIGLLVGGMQVAQQIGGAAGKAAATGMKRADAVFDKTKKIGKGVAVGGALFAGRELADRTGLTGAYMAAKNVKDTFKKNYANSREERIGASTDKWARGYAGAAGVLSAPAKWLKDKHNSAGKEAQRLREEASLSATDAKRLNSAGIEDAVFKDRHHNEVIKKIQEKIAKDEGLVDVNDNIEKEQKVLKELEVASMNRLARKEINQGGDKFTWGDGKWNSADGAKSFTPAEMRQHLDMQKDRHSANLSGFVAKKEQIKNTIGSSMDESAIEKTDMYKHVLSRRLRSEVGVKEKEAEKYKADAEFHQNAQNSRDKYLKYATTVVGGTLAAAVPFGVPAVLAMAGAGAGAKGALDVTEAAEKAASSGRQERIKKKMDDMKDDSDEKILATLNNSQKTSAERMAALLLAAKKDLVDSSDVRRHQAAMLKEDYFGGSKIERGNTKFKYDKVQNLFAANTAKQLTNEKELSRAFDKTADPIDQQRAVADLIDKIANGSLKMEKMSADRLKQAANLFADALNPAEFKKQMDALPQGIKTPTVKAIEDAIKLAEKEGNIRKAQAMKQKMALYNKRPDKYYQTADEKSDFGRKITKGQWDGMMKGEGVTKEQISGMVDMLYEAIKRSGNDITELNPTMQSMLRQKNGAGRELRESIEKKYNIQINIKKEDLIDNITTSD